MSAPGIAVVGHFFYEEQIPSIVELLCHIPVDFDLWVSVPAARYESVERVLGQKFPGKKIRVKAVVNRGYDIAPFLVDFRDIYAAYDLVLKIHTKKSSHTFCLKTWADYLLKNLTGSSEIVTTILKMFEENQNLGLVYPEIIPIFKQELIKDPWQGNWDFCRSLAARLGLSIEKQRAPEFPAGSMFWFRPKALQPLFDLGLRPEDFPEGKYFHRNGTLAHAIERLFVLIAGKQGFTSREVCYQSFTGVRDDSWQGRLQNAACCEWERWLHFLGCRR